MKRFDEAGPVYLEALKNDPNHSKVRAFYGVYLEKIGRNAEAEAEAEFRRARELRCSYDLNALLQELRRP